METQTYADMALETIPFETADQLKEVFADNGWTHLSPAENWTGATYRNRPEGPDWCRHTIQRNGRPARLVIQWSTRFGRCLWIMPPNVRPSLPIDL